MYFQSLKEKLICWNIGEGDGIKGNHGNIMSFILIKLFTFFYHLTIWLFTMAVILILSLFSYFLVHKWFAHPLLPTTIQEITGITRIFQLFSLCSNARNCTSKCSISSHLCIGKSVLKVTFFRKLLVQRLQVLISTNKQA